jgi:primosomal replication protein N
LERLTAATCTRPDLDPTSVAANSRHESDQTEAGSQRQVNAEIPAIAFDVQARLLAGCALERAVEVQGFLAAKSRRSKKLVLHATHIEFAEGE